MRSTTLSLLLPALWLFAFAAAAFAQAPPAPPRLSDVQIVAEIDKTLLRAKQGELERAAAAAELQALRPRAYLTGQFRILTALMRLTPERAAELLQEAMAAAATAKAGGTYMEMIAKAAPEVTIPLFLQELDSPDPTRVRLAEAALSSVAAAAGAPLRKRLSERRDSRARLQVIEILKLAYSYAGDDSAAAAYGLETLEGGLRDRDRAVQVAAAIATVRIQAALTPATRSILTAQYSQSDPQTRGEIVGLERFAAFRGARLTELLRLGLSDELLSLRLDAALRAESLAWAAAAARETAEAPGIPFDEVSAILVEGLNGDPRGPAAALALARRRHAAAAPELSKLLLRLEAQESAKAQDVAVVAMALARADARRLPEMLERIAPVLESDRRYVKYRQEVVAMLCECSGEAAALAPALRELLQSRARTDTRALAGLALLAIAPDDPALALAELRELILAKKYDLQGTRPTCVPAAAAPLLPDLTEALLTNPRPGAVRFAGAVAAQLAPDRGALAAAVRRRLAGEQDADVQRSLQAALDQLTAAPARP